MSSILLYIGTILIAFQMVGDLSHLFALITHSFWRLARALIPEKEAQARQSQGTFMRALKSVLWRVPLLLFIVVVLAIVVALFLVWVVGRLLAVINAKLNSMYAKALDPRETNYISMSRALAITMNKQDPAIDDVHVWERIKQRGFPFVGLIGIIILSAGFALQLLGH